MTLRNKKEKSRNLLREAYEANSINERIKLAEEALKLYPNNADAYIFLAESQDDYYKASKFYRKGMEAGRKDIGEKDFEEFKGHFWGFHETRPYMRAKAGYAATLYLLERYDESIQEYAKIIELNPNDNQGVRYSYASILVNHRKFEAYEKLRDIFDDEGSAMWLFTYAAYLFKKNGKSKLADNALKQANEANPHVLQYLVGKKEIPDIMPSSYGFGDESEAIIYLRECSELWLDMPAASVWVNDFLKKNKGRKNSRLRIRRRR
jgi:tetratricopeptide (TPR) repeat protein